MAEIKKIAVSGINYDLAGKYIQGTSGELKTWSDIESLVTAGFTIEVPWTQSDYESTTAPTAAKLATVPAVDIYYNMGATVTQGTLAATGEETRKHLYLIYAKRPDTGADNFDEYVSTGTAWEKIGDTSIDLSNYVQKATITLTGSAANAGAASINTSSAGAATADGTATIIYQKANVATGSAGGDGANDNTGLAGSATISGSSFAFAGTSATISIDAQAEELLDHSYTPAGTISGTATIDSHTHTATQTLGAGNTVSVVQSLSNFSGGSFTGASAASLVYGAASTGSAFIGATVSATGVLSFTSGTFNTDASKVTSWTANNVGTFIPASLGTISYATVVKSLPAITIGNGGGATISGSSFSFSGTTATISHSFGSTATISLSTLYQPAGSISGSATVASHSHSYVKPAAHTHGIGLTDTTITGTAQVSVASHTHSVSVASHTHSVSVSGNNYAS